MGEKEEEENYKKGCCKTLCVARKRKYKGNCKVFALLENTIKKPERHHWRRPGVFIVKLEQISDIILVFPLLTLNR